MQVPATIPYKYEFTSAPPYSSCLDEINCSPHRVKILYLPLQIVHDYTFSVPLAVG